MIFFVDYSIIDAKLFFAWLSHCYLMHSKKGKPSLHGWLDKQILGNVLAPIQHFYFDQQSEKILQAFQKLGLFNFCCWLEYYLFKKSIWQKSSKSAD